MDDPFELLGVSADATSDDVAAAYRAAAKRFHPDVAGDDADAAARMAEINAAYEAIRAGDARPAAAAGDSDATRPSTAAAAGAWLTEDTRRALGRELLGSLAPGEPVRVVTDTSTWASPQARLVATDRRLIWLHDDAVTHRVRQLRFGDIVGVEERLQWPRRRRAALRLRTRAGRRLAFTDLAPGVAAQLAQVIRTAAG